MMPASAPAPSGVPPAPDAVGAFAQQVRGMNLPPADIAKVADALEHGRQVISDLLDRRIITASALKDAVGGAKTAGKYTVDAVDNFVGRLPSTSDQPALRSALETHLEKTTKELVGLHVEAQSRGLDLSAMVNPASQQAS